MKTVKLWFIGCKVTEECQLQLEANQEEVEKAYKEDALLVIDGTAVNFKYVIKVEYESK